MRTTHGPTVAAAWRTNAFALTRGGVTFSASSLFLNFSTDVFSFSGWCVGVASGVDTELRFSKVGSVAGTGILTIVRPFREAVPTVDDIPEEVFAVAVKGTKSEAAVTNDEASSRRHVGALSGLCSGSSGEMEQWTMFEAHGIEPLARHMRRRYNSCETLAHGRDDAMVPFFPGNDAFLKSKR